ncbi:hypothetical protein EI94DRAFT_1791416 [Lactarius quietus]|nr:hypothetical protein EI94DRAFT_1791416 [Lactarius quietus]
MQQSSSTPPDMGHADCTDWVKAPRVVIEVKEVVEIQESPLRDGGVYHGAAFSSKRALRWTERVGMACLERQILLELAEVVDLSPLRFAFCSSSALTRLDGRALLSLTLTLGIAHALESAASVKDEEADVLASSVHVPTSPHECGKQGAESRGRAPRFLDTRDSESAADPATSALINAGLRVRNEHTVTPSLSAVAWSPSCLRFYLDFAQITGPLGGVD